MPNTKDEWQRRVEKAVETLGEATAMGMVPPQQVHSMIDAKAKEFDGNVPKFQDRQAGPPQGGGPGGPMPGGPPPGPGMGMPPGQDMERAPQEDFNRMKDDVLMGRMSGGPAEGQAPPRRPRR